MGGRAIRLLATATLIFSIGAGTALAQEEVRLYLDPSPSKLLPGQRQLVSVRVAGVPESGLAAFQLELRYDPRAVAVQDPNGGFTSSGVPAFAPLGGSPLCAVIRREGSCPDPEWMLTSTGRQAFGTSVDPEAGRLTIAYGTAGEEAPVTGDGALALLEVVGLAGGKPLLGLIEVILADASDPPRKYAARVEGPRTGPLPRGTLVELERP
jgi:hypothetical protein